MSCINDGEGINLFLQTKSGVKLVCALFDTGASITLIQPYLQPQLGQHVGYMELRGYQANSPSVTVPIYNIQISLDGQTWKTIEAGITTNMAEPMILSPQNIPNTTFVVTSNQQG